MRHARRVDYGRVRTCIAELDRRLPDLFRAAAAKEGLTALAGGDSRDLRGTQTLKFAPTAVNIPYRVSKKKKINKRGEI
eukprot:COSAG05_NODE_515_length_9075_cov_121.644719_3_plen_79_part_00